MPTGGVVTVRAAFSKKGKRMAIAREAEPVGSLSEVKEAGLDREDLLGVAARMGVVI